MKLETFPYTQCGTVDARVDVVTPDKTLQKQELFAQVARAVVAFFVERKTGENSAETKTCGLAIMFGLVEMLDCKT